MPVKIKFVWFLRDCSANDVAIFLLILSIIAASAAAFAAEEIDTLPEAGVPMLSPDVLFETTLRNPQGMPASSETVEIEGQPFHRALRVRTGKPSQEWWAIQLLLPTVASVHRGDTLLATFYIRGVETNDETGEAYLRAFLQTCLLYTSPSPRDRS